jgi:pyridoxal phosphate enzyme (YggS family)
VNDLKQRYAEIRSRIAEAAGKAGRNPEEIELMAVTKTRELPELLEVWEMGLRLFGENRVQEAAGKIASWPQECEAQWRLIGNLQRNKARKALDLFSRIDSLDRLELALDLQRILSESNRKIDVLIEVNTSGEPSKHGISPDELEELLEGMMRRCPHVTVRGLMTLGPLDAAPRDVAACFCRLRELRDRVSKAFGLEMPELSMGMSDDFEAAIEQGSTCVRIGRALFGPRN